MWGLFEEELADREFATREDYEAWVEMWANDMAEEAGHIGRYYKSVDSEYLKEEHNVDIKNMKGDNYEN